MNFKRKPWKENEQSKKTRALSKCSFLLNIPYKKPLDYYALQRNQNTNSTVFIFNKLTGQLRSFIKRLNLNQNRFSTF